jgi:hypothetical protein
VTVGDLDKASIHFYSKLLRVGSQRHGLGKQIHLFIAMTTTYVTASHDLTGLLTIISPRLAGFEANEGETANVHLHPYYESVLMDGWRTTARKARRRCLEALGKGTWEKQYPCNYYDI